MFCYSHDSFVQMYLLIGTVSQKGPWSDVAHGPLVQLSPFGKGCEPSFEDLNLLYLEMLCAKFN